MHKYMILVEVPSTAPLYGVDGLNTNRKVKCVGFVKSSNSSSACSEASKKLDIPYDKLKALMVRDSKNGKISFQSYKMD